MQNNRKTKNLMKAYIQTDKIGNYVNVNAFIANEGFIKLGYETEKFYNLDEIPTTDPEIIIVGGITNVRQRLIQLGIKNNAIPTDYPEELGQYLGRKVWKSTIEAIFQDESKWGIFIKPKDETKKFTGKVVQEYRDFIGLVDNNHPTIIWCSEITHFITEWRCYVRYGKILDIRQYKGAWDSKIDVSVVKNAINDFITAPSAYALDFGIDENGSMKLVEVNDGYSLGSYGMNSINYAKILSARWAQMTNTKDYIDF
jgi:ATP-grasp domain, R2K clade family 3